MPATWLLDQDSCVRGRHRHRHVGDATPKLGNLRSTSARRAGLMSSPPCARNRSKLFKAYCVLSIWYWHWAISKSTR